MDSSIVIKNIVWEKHKHQWEIFCQKCSNATFLHSYYWQNFLGRYFINFKPNHFAIFKDKEILGILPSFIEKNRIISLPYTGVGGLKVLRGKHSLIRYLVGKVISQSKNSSLIEIKAIERSIARYLQRSGFKVFKSHRIPILKVDAPENLIKKFSRNTRRNLIKAMNLAKRHRLNIIEVDSLEELIDYTALEKSTMRRRNEAHMPLLFWKTLLQEIPPKFRKILLLKKGDISIAGRISFFYKDIVTNFRGVSLNNFRKYRGNELLHYHIMELAYNNRYKTINFGPSKMNDMSTYIFKSKFGGRAVNMYSARFIGN